MTEPPAVRPPHRAVLLAQLDGATLWLYAPLSRAQVRALRRAWATVARFTVPTIRDVLAQARTVEDTPEGYQEPMPTGDRGPTRR